MNRKATFGAGCFWNVQFKFDKLDGVVETNVGYEGGDKINPTYEEVCSNHTKHIEVIEIVYDDDKIKYLDLLKLFFEIHDPTSVDRQGLDIGIQYRSVIFYHYEFQRKEAEKYILDMKHNKVYDYEVVTKVILADKFYKAEEYHQKYLEKQGRTTCSI